MQSDFFPEITVDGETLQRDAVIAEAQNHPAASNRPGDAWRSAARALVIRTLLLRRARAMGLTAEPQDLGDGRSETREEALIRTVMEAEIAAPAPGEADLRAFYDANPERFRGATLYEASHILFAADADDDAARAQAEARATAALRTIRDRPTAFSEIAKAESDCPSRTSGGRLGQFEAGDMAAEFEAALDALAPGEVRATPLVSRFGLHVVRLDGRADGATPPYEAVKASVRLACEKMCWVVAARAYVGRLIDGATIEGVSMRDAA